MMLISSNGTLVRTRVADVSIQGRNTQGVRLIRLDDGDRLTGVEGVQSLGEDGAEGLAQSEGTASTESDLDETPPA
jgi:DNA gyrase subunit A